MDYLSQTPTPRITRNKETPMKRTLFLLGLSLLLSPVATKAQITSVTGDATVVTPPSSVKTGTGTESLVFVEQENAVLTSPLAVDATLPFSYGDNGTLHPLTPGTIAAGTDVTSVYLHSWFSQNPSGTVYSGSITFSTPILGVEALDASLVATNSLLGVPTTTYFTTPSGEGFELSNQIDQFTISGDTLTYTDETFNAPDDLRIIVAGTAQVTTPEPTSLVLMGTGLVVLAGALVGVVKRKVFTATRHTEGS